MFHFLNHTSVITAKFKVANTKSIGDELGLIEKVLICSCELETKQQFAD